MVGLIVSVPSGYEIVVYGPGEVATTAENYCVMELAADGLILHQIPFLSTEGQRIADWLALT